MAGWTRTGTAALLMAGLVLSGCNNQRNADADIFTGEVEQRSSIWELFSNYDDPNVTLEVNRYLWVASMDVLSFLPVEAADPFSGTIVMGYGTPPGGRTSYRATVQITDPALDARSLNLALATRSGPVAPDTVRSVENAILTRARQLRIADGKL